METSPETRGFLIGTLLVMIISGPLILLAIVLGHIHSRFRLEITRSWISGSLKETLV
jgi:hypothetical protein